MFGTRVLPPVLPIFIALDLQNPKFAIKSGVPSAETTNNDFTFEIINPTLRVKRIRCLDSFVSKFEQRLLRETLKYPYLHYSICSFVIPSGVRNFQVHDLFGSNFLARHCAIFTVPQDWISGNFKSSPLDIRHNNVKDICLYANNSERIPSVSFDLDWSNPNPSFLHAFLALYGNDSLLKDQSMGIDLAFWSQHATIFMFWLMQVKKKYQFYAFFDIMLTILFNCFKTIKEKTEKFEVINRKKRQRWVVDMYFEACRIRQKERKYNWM